MGDQEHIHHTRSGLQWASLMLYIKYKYGQSLLFAFFKSVFWSIFRELVNMSYDAANRAWLLETTWEVLHSKSNKEEEAMLYEITA